MGNPFWDISESYRKTLSLERDELKWLELERRQTRLQIKRRYDSIVLDVLEQLRQVAFPYDILCNEDRLYLHSYLGTWSIRKQETFEELVTVELIISPALSTEDEPDVVTGYMCFIQDQKRDQIAAKLSREELVTSLKKLLSPVQWTSYDSSGVTPGKGNYGE